ncbi:MAG TPA: TSUP family transporter, partial [Geobacteraceae bacterium]
FGPGTGTFWAMAFMLGLGQDLTRATAHTKVMNFTSNAVALVLFVVAGAVRYPEGLVMGAGQFLGARLGAHLVIRRGVPLIRPLFLTMVLLISAKLLLDAWR